jgi:hypothetical protein
MSGNRGEGGGIGLGDRSHRGVREDDAEAEGIVRPIALDDDDVQARVGAFHQERKIQPSRTATDAGDPHHRKMGARFARNAS